MQLKRTKTEDAKTERYLIIALIMSENVCRSLKNTYDSTYFQTKLTREMSKWCFDYFEKYDTAMQKEIQTIYEMKSKAGKIEPDFEEEIENFLVSLSNEYEEWENFNEQFYIDLGKEYFKKRSYVILAEKLKDCAENGSIEDADREFAQFTKIQEEIDESRYILTKKGVDSLKNSLMNKPPDLFYMPGPLGQMMGPIQRESFIGILGREKVGKTFHLMMFAAAAAKQGKNVAMIETGDLSQDQLDMRWFSFFTQKTAIEANAGDSYTPVLDCLWNQRGDCKHCSSEKIVSYDESTKKQQFIVDVRDDDILTMHEPCIECYKDRFKRSKFKGSIWWRKEEITVWNWSEALKKAKRFKQRFRGEIVTKAFAMGTVSASDIRDWVIQKQKQDGFIPDVLIVDYPDILVPDNPNEQYRHQENAKWQKLKQISQEFHNSVIVVTQADAKSYKKDTLSLDNFSEDKRKFGHVTHFYAINKTLEEEYAGVSRFSTLLIREASLKITQQATILQNLSKARPYLGSFIGKIPSIKISEKNDLN